MRKGIFFALLLAILPACDDVSYVAGPDQTEEGVVTETIYTPDQHGSGASPTIDFNGNVGIAFTSVDIPKKWVVVVKCQHGKYIVDSGHNDGAYDLWARVVPGSKLTITYHEVYEVVSDNGAIKSRTFVKYQTTSYVVHQ